MVTLMIIRLLIGMASDACKGIVWRTVCMTAINGGASFLAHEFGVIDRNVIVSGASGSALVCAVSCVII